MSHSKKTQYTKKEDRVIYLILNPLTKEFFISHCQKNLLIDVFKHHYYGNRFQTKESFEDLKTENLHPCLFVLEELHSTKVEAYNYVIVWTKIFTETGYTNLNHGNVLDYIKDLYKNNLLLYNERKTKNLNNYLNCQACQVINYGRAKCKLYKGEEINE